METDKKFISFREEFCVETRTDPCGVVIFGASGDLTRRKLLPALYHLFAKGLLDEHFFVLGCARSGLDDDGFRERAAKALQGESDDKRALFLKRCFYQPLDYTEGASYQVLGRRLKDLDRRFQTKGNRMFYLATPPKIYIDIATRLHGEGLTEEGQNGSGQVNLVFEKPFGHDLESALALNRDLHQLLAERQIYRIDHYLGKETVQNIMMFRFANAMFEPVWNRRYIDHVQITVAENIGIGDRAGYYEQAGALRDMFQNHMLQMLALVAMEPPARFAAEQVRDETAKVLQSLHPFSEKDLDQRIVRGQYDAGTVGGQPASGYLQEQDVAPGSNVETFVAAHLMIDNWRWQGVPFYLRTGKRLSKKMSEVAIVFRRVPHSMFGSIHPQDMSPNVLVFNMHPHDGIQLTIEAKRPGPKLCMCALTMDFNYREIFGEDPPEAYTRLLLECLQRDQTLFIRHDAVETTWRLLEPVLKCWHADTKPASLAKYAAGSAGPDAADLLLKKAGHRWRALG